MVVLNFLQIQNTIGRFTEKQKDDCLINGGDIELSMLWKKKKERRKKKKRMSYRSFKISDLET